MTGRCYAGHTVVAGVCVWLRLREPQIFQCVWLNEHLYVFSASCAEDIGKGFLLQCVVGVGCSSYSHYTVLCIWGLALTWGVSYIGPQTHLCAHTFMPESWMGFATRKSLLQL